MTVAAYDVLVVDDEPLVALMVEGMLEDLGHRVLGVVHNLPAAMDVLQVQTPNLAVVDFELGRANSLDLLIECRKRGVPVVLSTGYGREDLPSECRDLALLSKPFSNEQLESAIALALNGSSVDSP